MIIEKTLLMLVLLLALSAPATGAAQAGRVTGRITDPTGTPLRGAVVQVEDVGRRAFARADGYYRVVDVPSGEHRLRVELMGYEPREVTVVVRPGQEARADVTLQYAPIALPGVAATSQSAQWYEVPINQVGNALSVVTSEEMEGRQVTGVEESLRTVPGLTVSRSGGTGSTTYLRMRGFTNKHVLVMIDGVRVTNPTAPSNEFYIDNILADGVERVEVLRGPQSGIYGSDAMAGVVNIITKKGRGPLRVSGLAEAGSQGTWQGGAAVNGAGDRIRYSLSGTYLTTDGISVASRGPANTESDGYTNLSVVGNVSSDVVRDAGALDALVVEVGGRFSDAEADTDQAFAGPPEYFYQDSDHIVTTREALVHGKASLELFEGRYNSRLSGSLFNVDSETDLSGEIQSESSGEVTGLNWLNTVRLPLWDGLLPELTTSFGVAHEAERGEFHGQSGLDEESISNSGLFGSVEAPVLNRLFLTLSGRLEDNERFGDYRTWRVSGAWESPFGGSDGITKIRASVGTGFESPSLQQLFSNTPSFQGNPGLQPEESRMWDVGVHVQLAEGRVRGEIGYYDGWADNGIFSVFDAESGVSTPENIEQRATLRGWETSLAVRPISRLGLDMTYTYTDARIEETGVRLFERPEHMYTLNAALDVLPQWQVGSGLIVRGDQLASFPSDYEMDGYAKLDLRTAWDVNPNITVYGRVENLTDADYEDRLGTGTSGRRFHLGMRAQR